MPRAPNDSELSPTPPPLVWSGYLHPWPLCAGLLLTLNDHLLKPWPAAPRWLTGKLSDVAGLFFFPLLAAAVLHLVLVLGQRHRRQPPDTGPLCTAHLAALCLATGLGFTAIQLAPEAADLYRALGAATAGLLAPVWHARPTVTMDPADLLALPVLALAFLHGRRHLGPRPARPRHFFTRRR